MTNEEQAKEVKRKLEALVGHDAYACKQAILLYAGDKDYDSMKKLKISLHNQFTLAINEAYGVFCEELGVPFEGIKSEIKIY